jgi:hypothetical protein
VYSILFRIGAYRSLIHSTLLDSTVLHSTACPQLHCTALQVKRLRDQIEDHICKGGPPVREEGKEGGGPLKSFARSGAVSQPVQAM